MSLPVYRHTAPKTLGSWLRYELSPDYCRDAVTLLAGSGAARVIANGTPLGAIVPVLEATAAAKSGGNAAGTGALTLDATTPVLAGAKVGVYAVRCIAAATNGGTFRVTDPDGDVIGDVAVGATFASQVKFSVADGAQDFVVGEGFDITVASDTDDANAGKRKAWSPTATDGSQIITGIAVNDAEAADGVDNAGGLVELARGPAVVLASQITWPAGVTDSQKAAAIAALALRGIVCR
jgi:hypothetical protein